MNLDAYHPKDQLAIPKVTRAWKGVASKGDNFFPDQVVTKLELLSRQPGA
jgi:hypothetical protein